MVRKWTVGATGFAVLVATFAVVACSSKSDDDDSGNDKAGKGGTTAMGGSAGKATGGATTGGSSGTGTTGGTGGSSAGTGGSVSTGGMAGSVAQGGMAGAAAGAAGAAASGPFACKGAVATCNTYSDFGTGTAAWWGSGDFNGGFSVFGDGITMDMTGATNNVVPSIHITGMVSDYGRGFNFWFTFCSDLSAFTGVTFTAKGTTGFATTMNAFDFQPQTNSDYPWQPRPADKKGGCTSTDAANPWNDCSAPTKHMTLMDTPQTVLWSDADLANGKPTPFAAAMSPKEIVGIQFQFPWASGATAYAVDVTLDDVSFAGAPSAVSCGTMVSGSAGGGGMGSGGMAGGAGTGAGAGGQAGATAGGAGMSGGGGQSGGRGGEGGMSGQGGASGGRGGASGGRGGAAGTAGTN